LRLRLWWRIEVGDDDEGGYVTVVVTPAEE
jgi:hypothetical protein